MDTLTFPVRRKDHFMYPAAMFRTKERPTHGGIDLTPQDKGKPQEAFAIEGGRVVIAGYSPTAGWNIMILGQRTGIRWWYGHLSALKVQRGEYVKQGELIGMTGTSGNSAGVHLHLEAHYPKMNMEIDPWLWVWDAPDIDGSLQSLPKYRTGVPVEVTPKPTAEKEAVSATKEDMFMRIIQDADKGHIYLVTDRGMAHITALPHVRLFQRIIETGADIEKLNSLEISTVTGYIAAAGARSRDDMKKAIEDAVSKIEIDAGPTIDEVLDEASDRLKGSSK